MCLSFNLLFFLLNIIWGQKHPRIWIVLNIVIFNSTFKGKYLLKCWITGLVLVLQRKSCAVPWNSCSFHHVLTWNVIFQMKCHWFYTQHTKDCKMCIPQGGVWTLFFAGGSVALLGPFGCAGAPWSLLVPQVLSAKTNLLTKPVWNCALLCFRPKKPFLWQLWCFCSVNCFKMISLDDVWSWSLERNVKVAARKFED